ncbi:hypothetical protein AWE51_06310 [Aquimarina aggregata]|uniref:Uncharacterized protein n=1 Tax=Aquimarina aggregata TaxID=1642818 RepID=A0A163AI11_9FLAO|nr:T9SS type A sorting domain-containing protein [Aquimarina aggregata]KZS40559.1 hypothetical protein AWE51_06310 [Aquimarina aggregata]
MKKLIFLGILLCLNVTAYAQNIPFNDINFKNALLNHARVTIDTNGDNQISFEEAENTTFLRIDNANISDLSEIKHFINLGYLSVSINNLTSIDISQNLKLRELHISQNKLTSIDVSKHLLLKHLNIGYNQLTSLDVTQNEKLEQLSASSNQLTSLDVTENKELENIYVANNQLVSLDLSTHTKLVAVNASRNMLTAIDVSQSAGLTNLTININELSSLDITKNPELQYLQLSGNDLTSLDLTQNKKLEILYAFSNEFTELDVSMNTELTLLRFPNNKLTSIDLSQNKKLTSLWAFNNKFTAIDISNNIALEDASLGNQPLATLDLSKNVNLTSLRVVRSQLALLDARNCNLTTIDLDDNPNLNIAYLTGQKFQTTPRLGISFKNCPEIKFICVDEEYIAPVQNLFNIPGYTSCDVSSSCDQNYYVISGKVTFDLDNDGCDSSDEGFSDLKFALSGGSIGFREVFPSNSGVYTTIVNAGDYFMFPIFENPAYFNIDPAPSFPPTPIRFPLDGLNVIKDFCVTPNGIHNDLEVVIIPTGVGPRPGFDTAYTIIYKNKGTSTQSGSVTLDYMQDILSLVSANPNTTSITTNQLSWGFSDLKPLESREITIVLNINKPTDTPAVNDGDILSYTATVTGTTDETPDDNIVLLNQTVRNSYDPNDKICLEGDTIEPKDLGKYLHYMIRFENKGTADAVNITVKDDIDTTKLDIKSFIPLKASHSYTTIVNNKKEVEFVFNDINLPFDDANNDGYILFKIKTKSDLKEGDVINNKAAIYFDFNLPIITEVEAVTIKKKVVEEPVFTDYFTLSPNPTTGIMSLTPVNTNISVQHISIHDIAGRIVGFFSGDTRDFNVSYLYANTYFMKLHSDKGVLSTTFIKIN